MCNYFRFVVVADLCWISLPLTRSRRGRSFPLIGRWATPSAIIGVKQLYAKKVIKLPAMSLHLAMNCPSKDVSYPGVSGVSIQESVHRRTEQGVHWMFEEAGFFPSRSEM